MNALLTSLNTENPLDARLEQIVEAAIARLQAGEPIDLAALAAEHPEYAAELKELLPTVARLVRLGDSPQQSATPTPADARLAGVPHEQLGDFRLVREIGRGGMGIVYEADQLSMGRKVALKVLPFAALVQDKSLQRFHNEVRAAAALDHAHIVPIYSVGEDRGVHFYAMQLIRGQTLANLVEQLKAERGEQVGAASRAALFDDVGLIDPSPARLAGPTCRDTAPIAGLTTRDTANLRAYFCHIARMGIQAAEALQHAHDQGVLHRDIKPSNLLVECTHFAPRDETATGARRVAKSHHVEDRPWRSERDGYTPKLWITDFGLARIEADAGMTMTGDIIGTLRYMAPEQALAKRVVIDHRADVYSLGTTLYELLTLEPAFGETDRSELLKQIAFEEPRPPRKLERRIPSELETIVLKAMAKEPDERYQTAQHLAGDLHAFLEDRPIKARPPSLGNRVWKWSRRHKSLVRTAALACLLVGVISAVGIAMVIRAHTRTVAALEETSDLLYTTDMRLAYETFEKGWSDEVQTILDRYRPTGQGPDRRGFEWHLLQKLVEPPASFALAGHEGPVNELAVFPDRERLASVGDDGTLRIWDVRERRLLRTIPLCNKPLYSVAISPDGEYAAAGSDILYLCDLKPDAQVTELHRAKTNIESIVFSPDGKQLAVGSRYEEVCLLSLDGEVMECIPCASIVASLEFVPDSPLLLVPNRRFPERESNQVGFVQIWNDGMSESVKAELDASHDDYCGRITMARSSACGRFVIAGERYGGRIFIFRARFRSNHCGDCHLARPCKRRGVFARWKRHRSWLSKRTLGILPIETRRCRGDLHWPASYRGRCPQR